MALEWAFFAGLSFAFLIASSAGTVMCWRYAASSIEFQVFRVIALFGCLAAALVAGLMLFAALGIATGLMKFPELGPPPN